MQNDEKSTTGCKFPLNPALKHIAYIAYTAYAVCPPNTGSAFGCVLISERKSIDRRGVLICRTRFPTLTLKVLLCAASPLEVGQVWCGCPTSKYIHMYIYVHMYTHTSGLRSHSKRKQHSTRPRTTGRPS